VTNTTYELIVVIDIDIVEVMTNEVISMPNSTPFFYIGPE
jgi:hypothetical protein